MDLVTDIRVADEMPMRAVFCMVCTQPTGERMPWSGENRPQGRCVNCTDIPQPAHMPPAERALALAGEAVSINAVDPHAVSNDEIEDGDRRPRCHECGEMQFYLTEYYDTVTHYYDASENEPDDVSIHLSGDHDLPSVETSELRCQSCDSLQPNIQVNWY